jgi:hypothetical protein
LAIFALLGVLSNKLDAAHTARRMNPCAAIVLARTPRSRVGARSVLTFGRQKKTREENQIKDDPKRSAAPRAVRPQPIVAIGLRPYDASLIWASSRA